MLVDLFLYNGETDMADLRVATLRDHVDLMVAVSCTLTHQSDPNQPTPPPEGCEWLIVDAAPIPEGRGGMGTPWWQWIERQHRDGCTQAVDHLPGDTIVLVSDVDEIPDPSTLPEIANAAHATPVAVPMRMHGFALNYLYPTAWMGTTASTRARIAPQAHRSWRHKAPRVGGGWHLSWFGDLDEKRRKLESFSHAELAGLDVEACWRRGIHANGERMTHLSEDVVRHMPWPAPMFDTYKPPDSWWEPGA